MHLDLISCGHPCFSAWLTADFLDPRQAVVEGRRLDGQDATAPRMDGDDVDEAKQVHAAFDRLNPPFDDAGGPPVIAQELKTPRRRTRRHGL